MKRRTFVRKISTASAATLPLSGALWGCSKKGSSSQQTEVAQKNDSKNLRDSKVTEASSTPLVFESHALEATLREICNQIIPSSESAAGAKETEVFVYIKKMLNTSLFSGHKQNAIRFAKKVESQSQVKYKKTFITLQTKEKILILKSQETQPFFKMYVTLCLEGYLSDPVYGGNKDGMGWQAVGFNMHHPRPQKAYIQP
jgi:gluconate 2-dehydrogenase gamma chain